MSEWIWCPKCGALMNAITGGHICPLCGYRVPAQTITATTGTSTEYVPVIRCKDCKRWNTIFDRNTAEYGLCQIRSQLETTRYDEYCSRAERKEE